MNPTLQRIIYNSSLKYAQARLKTLSIISPKRAVSFAIKVFCTPITPNRKSKTKLPLLANANKIGVSINNERANLYHYPCTQPNAQKILLVHGWATDSSFWKHYIPLLQAANFDIYSLDAIAHGLSTGKQTHAIEYQQLIGKVLELYGPFNSVLAHSLGTLTTAHAVHDTKCANDIKLVFISAAPYSQTHFNALQHILKITPTIMQGMYTEVYKRYKMRVSDYSIHSIIKLNPAIKILLVHDENDVPCPIAETRNLLNLNAPNVTMIETKGLGHNKIARVTEVSDRVMHYLVTA
jgi:pimeloyl-ACP methyl ester carboxylesterase